MELHAVQRGAVVCICCLHSLESNPFLSMTMKMQWCDDASVWSVCKCVWNVAEMCWGELAHAVIPVPCNLVGGKWVTSAWLTWTAECATVHCDVCCCNQCVRRNNHYHDNIFRTIVYPHSLTPHQALLLCLQNAGWGRLSIKIHA